MFLYLFRVYSQEAIFYKESNQTIVHCIVFSTNFSLHVKCQASAESGCLDKMENIISLPCFFEISREQLLCFSTFLLFVFVVSYSECLFKSCKLWTFHLILQPTIPVSANVKNDLCFILCFLRTWDKTKKKFFFHRHSRVWLDNQQWPANILSSATGACNCSFRYLPMPIIAVPFLNCAPTKVSFNNFYTTLISKYHFASSRSEDVKRATPPCPEFFTDSAITNYYKKGTLIDFMFLSLPYKVSGFATGWQALILNLFCCKWYTFLNWNDHLRDCRKSLAH